MALILKGLPQISQDGISVWFTDKTGAYNASSNEGGWGAPNVELNQSALLSIVYYLTNPKEIVNAEAKHQSGATNATEITFQADYLKDGHYEFYSIRLPVSADDTNSIDTIPVVFSEGDTWYNSVDGLVKQIVSAAVVTLDLTDTDVLDAIIADTSLTSLLCDQQFFKDLAVEKNTRYTRMRKARREEDSSQVTRMRQDMVDIVMGTSTAAYQFSFGLKVESQDTIETLLDDFNLN